MAGYAGRKKPSEGVATDLFAKALAIEDPRGTRLVIVTMDLIGVPRPCATGSKGRSSRRYGLAPQLAVDERARTRTAARCCGSPQSADKPRSPSKPRRRRAVHRPVADEARGRGRRRPEAAGAGEARFPARAGRFCHEPPPAHGARLQQRPELRRPGRSRGARAARDRSAGQAAWPCCSATRATTRPWATT